MCLLSSFAKRATGKNEENKGQRKHTHTQVQKHKVAVKQTKNVFIINCFKYKFDIFSKGARAETQDRMF